MFGPRRPRKTRRGVRPGGVYRCRKLGETERSHRLVYVSDALGLHVGVLLARPDQLGEGGKQALHANPGHVRILPGDERCREAREGKPAPLRELGGLGGAAPAGTDDSDDKEGFFGPIRDYQRPRGAM